jgi:hypothetical protein
VVFVPPTRGGKLVEMLTEKEEKLANITKFRVKYQEAGGTKLGLLFSTAGGACGRKDCQLGGKKTQEVPRTGIYYGESCRSLYERSREHL